MAMVKWPCWPVLSENNNFSDVEPVQTPEIAEIRKWVPEYV